MKKILLFIFFFTHCILLNAQISGNWAQTGPIQFPVNISGQIHGIGRTTQIKFHPTDSMIMYSTSASGGLFKSTDNGLTWAILGTDLLPNLQCASVCIDYTNDSVLYLGTGDPNYYGQSYGIYKSTDGGLSWFPSNTTIGNRMALEILLSPYNHNELIVATDNGIWKSYNAGQTWSSKLSGGQFTDMKFKPAANTNTIYACTLDEFYKSEDLGETWQLITNGTAPPAGTTGDGFRIAVSAADTNVVYVGMIADRGTIIKSTDGGNTFTTVYHNPAQSLVGYDAGSTGQGNYNFSICANPMDANEIYTAAHCVWKSSDGGITWTQLTQWFAVLHTDMHHILFNPWNNSQLWEANDGGNWMSVNGGTGWVTRSDGIGATEIYHAAQSNTAEDVISIGTQDNGELFHSGITWKCNRGGDWGPHCGFDYMHTNNVYYFNDGNRRKLIPSGGDKSLGFPFTPDGNTRMAFTKLDTLKAYTTQDNLYYTTNLNAVTPIWTQSTTTINTTIKALCVAPFDSNLVYAVDKNSKVYRIENAASVTPNVIIYNAPFATNPGASITLVPGDTNVVYLTCSNRIYKSTDKGATWTSITANYNFTNILKIYHDDYSTDESVYIGSSMGVWYRNNTMSNWLNYSAGLPTIANIQDLMLYNDGTGASKLRVAYYGRGVWESSLNKTTFPFAGFDADKKEICAGENVQFTDQSFNTAVWSWYFDGGTPATSTAQNPVVNYPTPGNYFVSLTVNNANGNNSLIKNLYIHVDDAHALPLAEGFENNYPPFWTVVDDADDGTAWQLAAPGGYNNSFNSMLFDNYGYDANGRRDEFRTPQYNFQNLGAAYLTFDHAYANYDPGYHDTLAVLVSTDCGLTFNEVYNKGYTDLETAPDDLGFFVPDSSQWVTDTIDMTPYLNQPKVLITFQSRGHYGNALYVDNINLHTDTGAAPVVAFTAFNTNVCAGKQVQFIDQSSGLSTAWNWTFTGGNPASSTLQNPTITFNSTGTFDATLQVTNPAGNSSLTKSNFINVNAPGLTASFTANGMILTATTIALCYQWFLNSIAIQGATSSVFNATQMGAYTLLVTDSNGCTDISLPTVISGIHSVAMNNTLISVYPNPNNGEFSVSMNTTQPGKFSIKVFNVMGTICFEDEWLVSPGASSQKLHLGNVAKGIYFLMIKDEKESAILKMVVQ
ncbi:MAG: PKD domain-containing protein [Bacteroidia bacterium]